MKKLLILVLFSLTTTIFAQNKGFYENVQRKNVALVLDRLNELAAKADFKNYFDLFADESTYIGTDASEIWNKSEFMAFAKPYFDRGKAWNFKVLKRNIYFSKDGKYAWFDELLDTQMKICRGSGVLERSGSEWKIKQYVLSMTVPNENVNDVVKIKTALEDSMILKLRQK